MAIQNNIRRLVIIRKRVRATAVLAWVFELIALTMEHGMEHVGHYTRFDKLAAIFLTMDSCFFTLWDVHLKFKDRNLAFGRVGCYFWPKHDNGQPSWAADIVCDVCSSACVICHFVVAIVDFVYEGHGRPTYVFTLVAFVLATSAFIPSQAYDRWFSAGHEPQQAETVVPAAQAQQRENEEAQVGVGIEDHLASASSSAPMQSLDNLETEIHCLQSRLTLLR